MLKITLVSSRRPRERFYLIKDGKGMGGAGLATSHYLNNYVVANGVERGNGYQGYTSVDYALSVDFLPEFAKQRIREAIK